MGLEKVVIFPPPKIAFSPLTLEVFFPFVRFACRVEFTPLEIQF